MEILAIDPDPLCVQIRHSTTKLCSWPLSYLQPIVLGCSANLANTSLSFAIRESPFILQEALALFSSTSSPEKSKAPRIRLFFTHIPYICMCHRVAWQPLQVKSRDSVSLPSTTQFSLVVSQDSSTFLFS